MDQLLLNLQTKICHFNNNDKMVDCPVYTRTIQSVVTYWYVTRAIAVLRSYTKFIPGTHVKSPDMVLSTTIE